MIETINIGNSPISDATVKESKTLKTKNKYDPNKKIYEFVNRTHKLKFSWIVLFYGWKYRAIFLTLVIVVVLNSAIVSVNSLLVSITLKQAIYDYGGGDNSYNYKLVWWGWMAITAGDLVLLYIGTYIRNSFSVMLAVKIEVELRNLAIRRLLEQDISYYSDKKIGKLMTKLVGDTNIIGNEITGMIAWVIQAPLVIVFGTIILFTINVPLAGVATILVYLLAFLVIILSISYKKKINIVREVVSEINGDVIDRVSAIKLVKSSSTRMYEEERIANIHLPYISTFKPIAKLDGHLLAILIASDVLISLFIIALAALLYGDDPAKFVILITPISTALVGLTRPLWQISAIIPGLSRAGASSHQIYELICDEPILSDNEENGALFDENIEKIEFRGVKFNYPEKPEINVIPNLDLVLEKGKSYAFVGETGSGKSTISKLLLRFYDPTEGSVLVNNKNLKDFNLKTYLMHVGYVEQEPTIIFGNVYDNVRYGYFQSTEEEIHEACKKAQIDKIIMSWPQGYKTILGERGLLLSGGQKQRLVIARILLKNPELLVLDEATSALDNIVEKGIQAQLNEIMREKTSVIIAHRLSTIKHVDQIFVLESGKGIIQNGTYEELIKVPGKFKDLHEAAL